MSRTNILSPNQMPVMRPLPMADGAPHREWELMRNWTLCCTPLNIIFFIPSGFIFNGASVPRVFSNIFPATGYLFIAALIHDYLYGNACYIQIKNGLKKKQKVDKKISDNYFADIAQWLYKDHWFKTKLAKGALVVGGQGAWDACRKIDGTYVKPKKYIYFGDNEEDNQ